MQEATNALRRSGVDIAVGLHRYAWHLPSLAAVVADQSTWRPKLALLGDQ